MLTYRTGNLLDSGADYICHQVNARGVMGSGIAKQIKERWPIVYGKYVTKVQETKNALKGVLGDQYSDYGAEDSLMGWVQTVKLPDHGYVVNMFAQHDYGKDGQRYTSYDAFYSCLERMARVLPKNATIAFPYKIGCGLGGADWEIISKMIERVLGDFNVVIYKLEENLW